MYTLSKDYEALYDLISKGHSVVGYADYKVMGHNQKKEAMRSVCEIKKSKVAPFSIVILSRGFMYGCVAYKQWGEDFAKEKEIFLTRCQELDVEWVQPVNGDPVIDMVIDDLNKRNQFAVNVINAMFLYVNSNGAVGEMPDDETLKIITGDAPLVFPDKEPEA